jgi:hypothetical protein
MKLSPVFAVLVGIGVLAAPARGDDVHLRNGKVYEGVVASSDGKTVTIQLAFGTLRLSSSQVDRIVPGSSSVAELLSRERILEESDLATAGDWLALALWSRSHGFASAARRAALEAASLDPTLEGLGPLLLADGYRFDEEIGRWIPVAEYMGRRGLVLDEGEWVSRQARNERIARTLEARRLEEEREAARQLRIATETLARTALLEAAREAREPARETLVVYAGAPWAFPVIVPRPVRHPDAEPPDADRPRATAPPAVENPPRPNRGTYRDLARRQPGSFLPLGSDRPATTSSRSGSDGP